MQNARGDVATAISGHGEERLTIVPIPTPDWDDHRIRRVIVTGENATLVKAAESALAGLPLVDAEKQEHGYLIPAEYGAVFASFLHPSRKWISVTPVLMSGHDDHDKKKRTRLIEKMFLHAGLPAPKSASEVHGRVGEFKVGSKHGHDKCHRLNLAVEFDREVAGVVNVGTGRFTGLGVFANLG